MHRGDYSCSKCSKKYKVFSLKEKHEQRCTGLHPCAFCGKAIALFLRFCNYSCVSGSRRAESKKQEVFVNCDYCGKKVRKTLTTVYKHNFCSRHHHAEWQKEGYAGAGNPRYGKPLELKYTCSKCGAKFGMRPRWEKHEAKCEGLQFCACGCGEYTRVVSGKTSKYLPGHNGRGLFKGEGNSQWRGGISNEPYAFSFNEELKDLIRKRDNYRCQLCGKVQGDELKEFNIKLAVHHKDYNKKNSDPDNLIALCASCNSRVNVNREYWEEYFTRMMNTSRKTMQGVTI